MYGSSTNNSVGCFRANCSGFSTEWAAQFRLSKERYDSYHRRKKGEFGMDTIIPLHKPCTFSDGTPPSNPKTVSKCRNDSKDRVV